MSYRYPSGSDPDAIFRIGIHPSHPPKDSRVVHTPYNYRMGCGNSKDVLEVAKETVEVIQTVGQRTMEHGVQGVQRAKNVFAKPLHDIFDGFANSKPPVFEKSAEEASFLKAALPKNFCFEQVSDDELQLMVDAMEKITIEANQVVIQQGSEGDYFYVIYSGSVNYVVNGVQVGSGSAGDSFGELSLLYTEPRAATVTADSKGEVILYRVDQTVFRYILQQQSLTESQEKIALLKKVSFLTNNLDDYSIHKVANVMTPIQFEAGTVIMKKGDTNANLFYILQSGSVKCTEVGAGDTQYQNLELQAQGDFFGERALITGEPRAATVTATTTTTCYTIDKQTFETVLGDFHAAISKANDSRKLVSGSQVMHSDSVWLHRCDCFDWENVVVLTVSLAICSITSRRSRSLLILP
jgi:cAMP-dependent protein kinase regulator